MKEIIPTKSVKVVIVCMFLYSIISLYAAEGLQGDLNKDKKVDLQDLHYFALQWLDPPGCSFYPDMCADLIGNDGVNFHDFSIFAHQWLKTEVIYLSGRDKDNTVLWDFFCTKGRQSGYWTQIPVPSNWELQGFGTYNYGSESSKANEEGLYKYNFTIPEGWNSRKVILVFEGVMTDTKVWVNGVQAGPIHQGGFYRFEYDITDLLNESPQTNLLEVTVSKVSADYYVEDAERKADYWVFGGIYRPVYLKSVPQEYIDWTSIDANAGGSFEAEVHLKNMTTVDSIQGRITSLDGQPLGSVFQASISPGQEQVVLTKSISGHQTWTAETPNLYRVTFTLLSDGQEIHTVSDRFGFRTVEVRVNDGVYVNGTRVRLKGVNRHCFWPDSGRALSPQICYDDVKLMKQMNMNAVRMSHYPPDTWLLDACDELGLYVLDELAGWQSPPYGTTVGEKLVKEMVTFHSNHPCILFWDNGNEGGWNTNLDNDFAIYDAQDRTVLHPWANFNGIDTDHYETYASTVNKVQGPTIFMTTEFLHGLYDGGAGAGLEDYWALMGTASHCAGGFLWALLDEGVVRTDMGGWIDTKGNAAPDGAVGPYREKEGSFYTIQDIWCPVQVPLETLPVDFNGTVLVENHYNFTNLSNCTFRWELVEFRGPNDPQAGYIVTDSATLPGPSVPPGSSGNIQLTLPGNWQSRDALYLTVIDPDEKELWTWNWNLKTPSDYRQSIFQTGSGTVTATENSGTLTVTAGNLEARFESSSGKLLNVVEDGNTYSFGNGPRLVPSKSSSPVVNRWSEPNCYVIEAQNTQGLDLLRWKIYASGWLEMHYSYQLSGSYNYFGVTFDYPEPQMLAKKWLGKGPYRVWKNRMRGTKLNVWQNNYNNMIPGQAWIYPEFKGYFSDMQWLVLQTQQGNITVATDTPDMFFRLYTPQFGSNPQNASAPMPDGNISFLHAIPPIGDKFTTPANLGPQSQLNQASGTYEGVLYFKFTESQ
jgi:beta-galactosidase/beta-glucuronidase